MTLSIGISGINATDNPGPGTGIARSLKTDDELDIRLLGLAYDAMEPGIYLDWLFDHSFILPYPTKGSDPFLARLIDIRDRHGLDVVIPSLDAELPLYIKYADRLAEQGIRTVLPDMDSFRLRGKDQLAEAAESLGIKVPRTEVVTSEERMMRAVEEIGLPVMIKGVFYQAYAARSILDAAGYLRKIVAEWGYPVIVQEMVTGDELNVVGVGDGEGGTLGLVGVKKMTVTSLGKVWSAVTVDNREMLETAERFVAAHRWNGPFELECIVNRDGVHLIEINPRFPAWVDFATKVGVNLPSRMLRRELGLPHETTGHYEPGKLFMRYTDELVTDLESFQSAMIRGET